MFAAGQRDRRHRPLQADRRRRQRPGRRGGAAARRLGAWPTPPPRADLADLLAPLNQPGSAWRENGAGSAGLCRLSRPGPARRRWPSTAPWRWIPESPDALRGRAKRHGRLPEGRRRQSLIGTVPPPAPAPRARRAARPRTAACRHDHEPVRAIRARPCRRWRRLAAGGLRRRSTTSAAGSAPAARNPTCRGVRISVMSLDEDLKVDPTLAAVAGACCRRPIRNPDWPQPGGYPSNAMYHLEAPGPLREVWDADAGKGIDTDSRLTASPVVGGGRDLHAGFRSACLCLRRRRRPAGVGQAAGAQERHRHAHPVGPAGQAQHHRAAQRHGRRRRL